MKVRRCLAAAAVVVAGGCSSGKQAAAPGSTTTAAVATTTTAPPATAADAGLRLDIHGLGPVRVGMTLAQAQTALGRPLQAVAPPSGDCALYAPPDGLEGVSFLVSGGTVASVVVTGGPTATTEGLAIGQTEAEAQRRYGGKLKVTPNDFLIGGHELTLVPAGADAGFRLVAETDGRRVTALRAGRQPEVGYSDGCS
ncbi:MAG TPA: hypothetical protein VFJ85_11710 [Acidimicrobiales bacterium]|nr:hypothetical protein [Acidimicrobiales bacterium]